MSSKRVVSCGLFIVLIIALFPALIQGTNQETSRQPQSGLVKNPAGQVGLTTQQLGRMPLAFTKNEGQWDERVLYRTSAGGATVWLTREGITYQYTHRVAREEGGILNKGTPPFHPSEDMIRGKFGHKRDSIEMAVVHAKFANPNPDVTIKAEGMLDYKCNYFLGNDPSEWRTDVPNYSAVVYRDVYPGVDLQLAGGPGGELRTTWAANSEADLAQINFEYEGNVDVSETTDGELLIDAPWGAIRQASVLSQGSHTRNFSLLSPDNSVSPHKTASVTLVYSTYLGGRS